MCMLEINSAFMKEYDYVFIILVHRNTSDLEKFFLSFNIPNSKVIVVNSYYDEVTDVAFKNIAITNNSDYISVPNRGYGAGNNRGCEYALQNYAFKYLVISNADIVINRYLPADILPKNAIIAPRIKTLRGKDQNPYMVLSGQIVDKYKYLCLKNNWLILLYVYYFVNRLLREAYLVSRIFAKRKFRKISSAHGAHCIIAYDIIKEFAPIYNERMFLFCEEEHLAKLAATQNIPIYYCEEINITHMEDGSVGITNINQHENKRKSFVEYYKYWYE